MPDPPDASEHAKVRGLFRRCSPETIDAILRFRQTGDPAQIATVARGIVESYLAASHRPMLATATAETPLDAFGIESLTMLEIVLDLQEALAFEIPDDDLRTARTLGDLLRLAGRSSGPPQP
jgi:3-hydroxyacyl-[acyl-carrier-protein] dehydratase